MLQVQAGALVVMLTAAAAKRASWSLFEGLSAPRQLTAARALLRRLTFVRILCDHFVRRRAGRS